MLVSIQSLTILKSAQPLKLFSIQLDIHCSHLALENQIEFKR